MNPLHEFRIVANEIEAAKVRASLALLPEAFVSFVGEGGLEIRVMEPRERFRDVNPRYRMSEEEEQFCLGLYSFSQQQVVLRRNDGLVLAHELFHRVDHSLGDGVNLASDLDDDIRRIYRRHRDGDRCFISQYASVHPREMVAEVGARVLGFSAHAPGRPHDRIRVSRIDPMLFEMCARWLRNIGVDVAPPELSTATPVAPLS